MNDIKIFFSLSEYKENYEDLRNDYLHKFHDLTELDFIQSEIKRHEIYKKIVDSNPFLAFSIIIDPTASYCNDDPRDLSLKNNIEDPYAYKGSSIFAEHWDEYNIIKTQILEIEKWTKEDAIVYYQKMYEKIIEFLKNMMAVATIPVMDRITSVPNLNIVSWQGTDLEFAELIKALIVSKKLDPNLKQNEIFNRLRKVFGIEAFNERDKIRDIQNRINSKTPLLDKLNTCLENWINRK